MDATYPVSEKLKSKKTIERLFKHGRSVSKFPLRLVFVENPGSGSLVEIGVSVSKRHFKRAHDRNFFKRQLREAYRLNKQLLSGKLDGPFAFMLLYQTEDRLTHGQIQQKTRELFAKFHQQLAQQA